MTDHIETARAIVNDWLNGNLTDAMDKLLAITQFNHNEGLRVMIHISFMVGSRDLAKMRDHLERMQHA
jgi:hypothetical protein